MTQLFCIPAESISTAPDTAHRDVQEIQDTVQAGELHTYAYVEVTILQVKNLYFSALQKAGKHMENSIAASYAALLIGCVIQFDEVRGVP